MLQIVNMCVHSFLSVTYKLINYHNSTVSRGGPNNRVHFHFLAEGSTESRDNDECVHTVREGALNGEKTPYIHLNQKHKSYNTSLLFGDFEG